MRYVSFNPRHETLPSRQASLVKAPVQRTGASSGGTLEDLQAFLGAIHYQYEKPTSSLQGEEARDKPGGVSLHLLHVGFSLTLPDRCQLMWVRFIVESGTETPEDGAAIQFVSLLPDAVYRETDFIGPIKIAEEGALSREVAAFGTTGSRGSRFMPWTLGFLVDPHTACWDFFPLNGRPPLGSQDLIIGMYAHPGHNFVPRQSLNLHVQDPVIGSQPFVLPADTDDS